MSLSSSSNDYIASLNLLQTNIYRIGGPILVVFGTLSCLLSLIIFTQKDLRKSPCAIYFVAYNIANLVYVYFVIFITSLGWGYSIDPSDYNIVYCRFRFYFYYLFGALSPFYLILASIDRTLITSSTIRIRQWSTPRVAYLAIASITIFWMVFEIHTLIYMNIYQINPYDSSCTYTPGIYTTFVNYYQLIVRGLLVPLLMLVSGLLTVKNIRGIHRIAPAASKVIARITVGNGRKRLTQKDRQFILMLFIDIIIYILCTIPRPVYLIYTQATQYETKSAERQAIEGVINSVSLFTTFIPTCVGLYTNFLVSKNFRQNVKKILQANGAYCFCQSQ
jgi:hypothetical protein